MSATVVQLRRLLLSLHGWVTALEEGTSDDPGDPLVMMTDIQALATAARDDDRAQVSAMLFSDQDTTILRFIRSSFNNKAASAVKARVVALELIAAFVNAHPERVRDSAPALYATCRSVIARDASGTVLASAFEPLTALLKQQFPELDKAAVDPPALVSLVLRLYPRQKTQRVKCGMLVLLGTLTEQFASSVLGALHDKILRLLMAELEKNFRSRTPEATTMDGAFRGLTALLTRYPERDSEGSPHAKKLYMFLSAGLDLPPDMKRYAIPIAAARMLTLHATQFRQYLTVDAENMYPRLRKLIDHTNKDVSDAALDALESFLAVVACELVAGKRSSDVDRATFLFFAKDFMQLLQRVDEHTASMNDASVAVRGLGRMAAPLLEFMGVDELRNMLNRLLALANRFFTVSPSGDVNEGTSIHLPSFLGAYANIIFAVPEMDDSMIEPLERMAAIMLQAVPQQFPKRRQRNHQAFLRLLLALHSKGAALRMYLARVYPMALVLTASNMIKVLPGRLTGAFGAGDRDGSDERTPQPVWRDYMSMWALLFTPEWIDPDLAMDEDHVDEFHQVMYDELLRAILSAITRLDLQYRIEVRGGRDADADAVKAKQQEQEQGQAQQAAAADDDMVMSSTQLVPNMPKDHELFLNLVDFLDTLLRTTQPRRLLPWAYTLMRALVSLSSRLPLISGFYKLARTVLHVCETQGYFDADASADKAPDVDDLSALVQGFLADVLKRLEHFTAELLASATLFVLNVPRRFVRVPAMMTPLRLALRLGTSVLPLADAALDAVERWLSLDRPGVAKHFAEILPLLNDYLNLDASEASRNVEAEERSLAVVGALKRRTAAALGRTDVAVFQQRVLAFLGSLGGDNVALVQGSAQRDGEGGRDIAWDSQPRLRFILPFPETKPSIYLDSFIPRLIDLSQSGGDRETKLAACELLHSIVLYMLGSNASHGASSSDKQATPLVILFEHMFPALLRLACDMEPVAKQLFSPLMLQIVRWFSKGYRADNPNPEVDVLLDAVVDGVASEGADAAMREYCAACLAEFTKWSIKHSKSRDMTGSLGFKGLMKRLYALLRHPNPYKRLGGVLTIDRMYRVLREDPVVVDNYILELTSHTLFALRLAHTDDPSLATVDETLEVMAHLIKIISQYARSLDKPVSGKSSKRRGYNTLADFVTFLLTQICRRERACRHQAMGMFVGLAPLLRKYDSVRQWLDAQDTLLYDVLFDAETATAPAALTDSKASQVLWLTGAEMMLDVWAWVLRENLCAASAVLVPDDAPMVTRILRDLLAFVHQSIDHAAASSLAAPHVDDAAFDNARADAVVALLALLRELASERRRGDAACLAVLADTPVAKLILVCVMQPGLLARSSANLSRHAALVREVTALMDSLAPLLVADPKLAAVFQAAASSAVDVSARVQKLVKEMQNDQAGDAAADQLQGLALLRMTGVLPADAAAAQALLAAAASLSRPTPRQVGAGKAALCLAFALGLSGEALLTTLCDATPAHQVGDSTAMDIDAVETQAAVISTQIEARGEHFYRTFAAQIEAHVIADIAQLARPLCQAASSSSLLRRLVRAVVSTTRSQAGSERERVLSALLPWLPKLARWPEEPELPHAMRSMFLSMLATLLGYEAELVLHQDAPWLPWLLAAYSSCLSRSESVGNKASALRFAHHFLRCTGDALALLKQRIVEIVVYDMPHSSSDLEPGTAQAKEYRMLIHALFVDGLERCDDVSGPVLLQALLPLLRERQHRYAEILHRSLQEFFSRLSAPGAMRCFQLCWDLFQDPDRRDQHDMRLAIVQNVMVPLLNAVPQTAAQAVFRQHVNSLLSIVSAMQDHLPMTEAEAVEAAGAFNLVEMLFVRLSDKESRAEVNRVFCPSSTKGNELTVTVLKSAHAAKSKQMMIKPAQPYLTEFRCAAYNCAAGVVLATQTQKKFFVSFLFAENPAKNEYLWDHIVDTTKEYCFTAETRFGQTYRLLAQTQAETRARKAAQEQGTLDELASATQSQSTASYAARREEAQRAAAAEGNKYVGSKYLIGSSSLSQDVPQLSFLSNGIEAPSAVSGTAGGSGEALMVEPTSSELVAQEWRPVDLELDELNSNPAMSRVLRVIDHMSTVFAAEEQDSAMPAWMTGMLQKISSRATAPNVKLFLAKVVLNRWNVFERYAAKWAPPLMSIATSPMNGGDGFHYFVRDICEVLMFRWPEYTPTRTPDNKQLIARFVMHLVRHCYHESTAIVRSNLNIIKVIVERWRDFVQDTPRVSLIMRTYFDTPGDPRDLLVRKRRSTGLQLLGVFVSNGLPLYHPSADADVDRSVVFSSLMAILGDDGSGKELYEAAAEVYGIALANYADTPRSTNLLGVLSDAVENVLKDVYATERYDRFLVSLYRVGMRYPPFISRFIMPVMNLLPRMVGETRVVALQIVLLRVEAIEHCYLSLVPILPQLVSTYDVDTQQTTLAIILKLLRTIDDASRLASLLQLLHQHVARHDSYNCRDVYLTILIYTWDNRRTDLPEAELEALTVNLLHGMSDAHPPLRAKMLEFWNNGMRLDTSLHKRLQALLTRLYHRDAEAAYISYANYLLLELTRLSPDMHASAEPLFQPLEQCEFARYDIDARWQARAMPMTPLFAPSQSQADMMDTSLDDNDPGMVAATVPQQFSMTQQAGDRSSDILDETQQEIQQTLTLRNKTALMFRQGAARRRRAERVAAAGALQQAGGMSVAPSSSAPTSSLSATFSDLADGLGSADAAAASAAAWDPDAARSADIRRRFAPSSISKNAAKSASIRAVFSRRLREERQNDDRRKRRAYQVKMLRSYRRGELPDVQIRARDIVDPLQVLASRDKEIAWQLFIALFQAIYGSLGAFLSAPEEDQTKRVVLHALQDMLQRSACTGPFVATILRLAVADDRGEIVFPAELVGETAMRSLNYHIGAMLLEKQLVRDSDAAVDDAAGQQRAAKQRRIAAAHDAATDTSESDNAAWGQLERLYRALNEDDVLIGIFRSTKLSRQSRTRHAIEAELAGEFSIAHDLYSELAAQTDDWPDDQVQDFGQPSREEQSLWERGFMFTLQHLCQWESVADYTLATAHDSVDNLWSKQLFEVYFHPYFHSMLRLPNRSEQLYKMIDDAAGQPDRQRILEAQFSVELALVAVMREDYERARAYIQMAYDAFLARWTALHPLAEAGRQRVLSDLQRILELDEFLRALADPAFVQTLAPLRKLEHDWSLRQPSTAFHDTVAWDDVIFPRHVMYRRALDRLDSVAEKRRHDAGPGAGPHADPIDHQPLVRLYDLGRSRAWRQQATAARQQHNLPVAKKWLEAAMMLHDAAVRDMVADWPLMREVALYEMRDAEACADSAQAEAAWLKFLKAIRFLRSRQQHTDVLRDPWHRVDLLLLVGEAVRQMIVLTDTQDPALLQRLLAADATALLFDQATPMPSKPALLVQALTSVGADVLGQAAEHAGNLSVRDTRSGAAFYAFGSFADAALRRMHSSGSGSGSDSRAGNRDDDDALPFARNTITAMLEAQVRESQAARLMFPRLIELASEYPSLQDVFRTGAMRVPCWQLIRWLPQMLAVISSSDHGVWVVDLLQGLCRDYPNAVRWPLTISREGMSEAALAATEPLAKLVYHSPSVKLAKALGKLTHPEAIFNDLVNDVYTLLSRKAPLSDVRKAFSDAYQVLFSGPLGSAGSTSSAKAAAAGKETDEARAKREAEDRARDAEAKYYGRYQVAFASEWKKAFTEAVRCLKDPLYTTDKKSNSRVLLELLRKMQVKMRENVKPKGTAKEVLTQYSTWLSSFEMSNHNPAQAIELPGQYDGLSKPMPELHVSIVSFDKSVLTMGSIRKPKRINIRCTDEREYPWLVKGGEDLRLDQRIQQMFALMNDLYGADAACARRNFALRRYQVVPMTTKVGLIEWMNNTRPLKAMIESSMQAHYAATGKKKSVSLLSSEPARAYLAYMNRMTKDGRDNYLVSYTKSRTDIKSQFRQISGLVPWNLLQMGIQSIAASPEAYFSLRGRFVRTLAVVNASTYILGVGDRHLDNWMVDEKRGGVIAIDFGHAFGSATQVLPVPEVVPMRLTPQLVNLLRPLDTQGLYALSMTHVLRCLHRNRSMLLNAMDVFVKEPLIDWETHAMKLAKHQTSSEAERQEIVKHYPAVKIAIARRKLELGNPAYIIWDEVSTGVLRGNKKYLKAIETAVKGTRGKRGVPGDVRADVGPVCRDLEQQVACLIDMATDPALLGRMWAGWSSWC